VGSSITTRFGAGENCILYNYTPDMLHETMTMKRTIFKKKTTNTNKIKIHVPFFPSLSYLNFLSYSLLFLLCSISTFFFFFLFLHIRFLFQKSHFFHTPYTKKGKYYTSSKSLLQMILGIILELGLVL
jgi:hypothetical protein